MIFQLVVLLTREVILGGIWGIWEGFRGGDGGGRLDLLATQQIHGSKPTKHQQNSQNTRKNFGAIFVGIFGLEKRIGGSEIVINLAHDTKMM